MSDGRAGNQGDEVGQAERQRLAEAARGDKRWRRWGTYLAERQWGTVREDYSASGDAWSSFPHDHARARAYRWGEDGLLGFCDDQGLLCFSLALWNGRDRLLKERPFGLTNPEGNHGEDVKECYYYLDGLPTAAYMKGLYKYPQAEFPYQRLIDENRARGRGQPEFELTDTGIFDGGRYFDVFVEYAKAAPDDILMRVTIHNRGPERATLHALPTLWFRNTWSWKGGTEERFGTPSIRQGNPLDVVAQHAALGRWRFAVDAPSLRPAQDVQWLFTDNVTNNARLYGGENERPHVKDAFHDFVVGGKTDAVNPERSGTKCAALWRFDIPAGGSVELRLRLFDDTRPPTEWWGPAFDEVFRRRIAEADAFYAGMARPQDAATLRQASAGLVWSKQFYYYDVKSWLSGDPIFPPPPEHQRGRNHDWGHVYCRDVISMPDKWEFPWFAAWDLAFHTAPLALLDPEFAQEQLVLMLREWYQHPNGQIPAYEYNFGDVNPPVHAWACRALHDSRLHERSPAGLDFFIRVYTKLALNFTWWVNRKDAAGRNLFSGGFLGLDNIGVFDRSMALPNGATLEQADGTAWMAAFCGDMLRMAMALSKREPAWEDVAVKFLRHYVDIRRSINALGSGGSGLWDEEDGFYYDTLRVGGREAPLKVRSMVGLLPLVGASVLDAEAVSRMPGFLKQVQYMVEADPSLRDSLVQGRRGGSGESCWLVALPSRRQLERMLRYVFDENEFLSPHGIRSLSKAHAERPYVFEAGGQAMRVGYLPGESDSTMFGGNSNWRGPVWFPVNVLLIDALATYHDFYGDGFKVELPTGSGRWVTLREAAADLSDRLLSLFRPDASGRRPVHGGDERYARDPNWKDLILFNEYFHGDTGRGCGASHQTGWTGLAVLLAHALKAQGAR